MGKTCCERMREDRLPKKHCGLHDNGRRKTAAGLHQERSQEDRRVRKTHEKSSPRWRTVEEQTRQVSRITRESHGFWQFLKAHGGETQCTRIFVNLMEYCEQGILIFNSETDRQAPRL